MKKNKKNPIPLLNTAKEAVLLDYVGTKHHCDPFEELKSEQTAAPHEKKKSEFVPGKHNSTFYGSIKTFFKRQITMPEDELYKESLKRRKEEEENELKNFTVEHNKHRRKKTLTAKEKMGELNIEFDFE